MKSLEQPYNKDRATLPSYDPTTERWTVQHDTLPFTPAQKRRMNSLRNCARMLAREIQSSTPAGPNQDLAIRHVEDALTRASKAILEDAQDTAEQSWTVYFDLEDSGSYVIHDGVLFREEPGGTFTPVGKVQKSKNF